MKRFLGVLVASMFLASAAFAADTTTKDTKDAKTAEKKSDTKGSAKAADSKGGAKAADTKGGAMGDAKKSETAKEKTADKPATK